MIRVFIIDDHAIVREGVKRIISDAADIEAAGESGNGPEALPAILGGGGYDVVLLDLNLPGMDGLEVLRRIKTGKPSLPVIILSIYPEEDYALRAYREGASGYVTKGSLPSDLIKAIRKAAGGKRYISEALQERLMGDITGTSTMLPHESLSSREYDVFRMIVSGKAVKEMAGALSLAPTTVSSYRARVLEKMGMKTNVELVRYALDHHLMI
jgi:two-component system, NarL family, invasion response regulator UvrY